MALSYTYILKRLRADVHGAKVHGIVAETAR
jgi:hypothetical protein